MPHLRPGAIRVILLLPLLFVAAACSSSPGDATPPPLPAFTQTARPTAAGEDASTRQPPATQEISPTPTLANQLDAAATFEVIAAVHANLLQIDGWLPMGFSVFERQAVVRPLAEIGMAPLSVIFADYLPYPDLAGSWVQAATLHQEFYPRLESWANGDLEDAEFLQDVAELLPRSQDMLAEAEPVAARLGVEPGQFGPDYAGAQGIVFKLLPGSAGVSAGWQVGSGSGVTRRENPEMVVKAVTPFVYPFAGMDVILAIGLIENTGDQAQQAVEVEIRFFNFLGEHLGTLTGRGLARVALPGEVYPFSASIVTEGEEAALKDWVDTEITVFSQPFEPVESVYTAFDLERISVTQTSSGSFTLVGSLVNLGGETVPVQDIHIGAIAFGSAGELVGVGSGLVLLGQSLSPGATAEFQAVLEAVSGEPETYQFFAQAILQD